MCLWRTGSSDVQSGNIILSTGSSTSFYWKILGIQPGDSNLLGSKLSLHGGVGLLGGSIFFAEWH